MRPQWRSPDADRRRAICAWGSHAAERNLLRLLTFLPALAWISVAQAAGGATAVDVELVLAVDVSYSMDQEEQRLQRAGYAEALRSPDFLRALQTGANGKIAVAYAEWASSSDQTTLVTWTLIDGAAAAQALADRLEAAPYRRASRTSVSGGIDYAVSLFDGNGFAGTRRVIDVSGDGPNNSGRPVTVARDEAVAKGFTINGLPLLIRPTRYGYMDIDNLDEYYADCVIGGDGAFNIPVKSRQAFVDATRTKLVMEIAAAPPAALVIPVQVEGPRVSCLVGEGLWRQRLGN